MLETNETAELLNLLGDVDARAGDYTAAAVSYQHAARMAPTEEHLFDWGDNLLRLRAYDDAVDVFAAAVRRHPGSARLHIGLGIAQYSRGRHEEAVASFCTAADLAPADPRPYAFLGEMYGVSPAQSDEITKRLARFVALKPRDANGQYYYAMSLWRTPATGDGPDLARVEALLRKAAALDARHAKARVQLGIPAVGAAPLARGHRGAAGRHRARTGSGAGALPPGPGLPANRPGGARRSRAGRVRTPEAARCPAPCARMMPVPMDYTTISLVDVRAELDAIAADASAAFGPPRCAADQLEGRCLELERGPVSRTPADRQPPDGGDGRSGPRRDARPDAVAAAADLARPARPHARPHTEPERDAPVQGAGKAQPAASALDTAIVGRFVDQQRELIAKLDASATRDLAGP
jgi:hypothetical protein